MWIDSSFGLGSKVSMARATFHQQEDAALRLGGVVRPLARGRRGARFRLGEQRGKRHRRSSTGCTVARKTSSGDWAQAAAVNVVSSSNRAVRPSSGVSPII